VAFPVHRGLFPGSSPHIIVNRKRSHIIGMFFLPDTAAAHANRATNTATF